MVIFHSYVKLPEGIPIEMNVSNGLLSLLISEFAILAAISRESGKVGWFSGLMYYYTRRTKTRKFGGIE